MGQHACSEVTLAVDTKKYGIRIHKALFRQLGSPSQIQLLVNPEAKLVAIQPVEKGTPGKQGHRIIASRMQSENSYELYSRLFVQRLRVLAPELEDGQDLPPSPFYEVPDPHYPGEEGDGTRHGWSSYGMAHGSLL